MEYRFFYPINQYIYNAKWQTRSDLENRTDIYFILPQLWNTSDDFHLEHGLKLRNKKKLELKIRQQRYPDGQELWVKTIHSHRSIQTGDMDSIIKALKKSHEDQLIERLLSSQPLILCYVSKFREQSHNAKGLIQELTGLHLRFIRSDDQSQIGNDVYFETVCVEQSNSKLIDQTIIQSLPEEHRNIVIVPMSYPQFLFQLYQQIINA